MTRSTAEMAKRELLRHTVATLAYRGAKAVRGAPEGFASLRIGDTTRTPAHILAHVGDLLEWALWLAKGRHVWHDSTPLAWDLEVARFFDTLARFDEYLASDATLGWPMERLFQGPIADALTHVGQLTMLRRLAGAPVRGESYDKADISAGRVGPDQPSARLEFD
ncbi:MAG: hypothetical protein ABR543_01615 [Gemmatimonadaceae bacterium]